MIHVVSQRLDDLSDLLASVGSRDDVASVYQMGRGGGATHGGGPDYRDAAERPLGKGPRDI